MFPSVTPFGGTAPPPQPAVLLGTPALSTADLCYFDSLAAAVPTGPAGRGFGFGSPVPSSTFGYASLFQHLMLLHQLHQKHLLMVVDYLKVLIHQQHLVVSFWVY